MWMDNKNDKLKWYVTLCSCHRNTCTNRLSIIYFCMYQFFLSPLLNHFNWQIYTQNSTSSFCDSWKIKAEYGGLKIMCQLNLYQFGIRNRPNFLKARFSMGQENRWIAAGVALVYVYLPAITCTYMFTNFSLMLRANN